MGILSSGEYCTICSSKKKKKIECCTMLLIRPLEKVKEKKVKKKDQLRRKENPWSDFCALILFPDIKD